MGKLAGRGLVLAVVIGLLGVGSYAIAGGGSKDFRGSPLNGYEENPDISTLASGSFEARLSSSGNSIDYKLSYSGLEGNVLQSHVHFAKRGVNGGISFFLCGSGAVPAPTPAGTPACPQQGTVTGNIDAADVLGPNAQGIAPGQLNEILAAMRAGHAYANVHTSTFVSGEIRAQINDRRGHKRGHDDDD